MAARDVSAAARAPGVQGTGWYRFFKATIFAPVVKLLWRPQVRGVENIPVGGAILAANHLDAADTLALPASIKPAMTFPAKKELFEGKTFTRRVVAWFLRAVGQAPIDRTGGKASLVTLGSVEQVLADGGVVGIFPEGSRSPDGNLYKGHTGVARLALESGKPVVPVGLINTQLRKNRLGIPLMHEAQIIIGQPLDFSAYRGREADLKTLRWVTNEVMSAIQHITGQRYIDVYPSRVKYGDLKGKDVSGFELPSPNHGRQGSP